MGKLLMIMNSEVGEFVCEKWSKVQIDNEYGYFAQVARNVGLFVKLNKEVHVIGMNGKKPKKSKVKKIVTQLIVNEWADLLYEEELSPFGEEYDNKLPFVVDNSIINLGGRL